VDPELESRKADLTRMGYGIRYEQADLFVASFARWYWECMVTKISFLVLVRRVAHLTRQMIKDDLAALAARATEYDPSALPRGFQKGRALVTFYVADTADADAIELAKTRPALDFASFAMAGVVDRQGNEAWYDKTAVFGAVYYAKFHHLLRRLVRPTAPPVDEPLSIPGVIITALLVLLILSPCICCIPLMLLDR
jgi:hypothetical protein